MVNQCSENLNISQGGNVQFLWNDPFAGSAYNLNMQDWYLSQWLETLRVNAAELSRRTDYPKAKISDLVNGKQRYNRDIINDVTRALNLQPFELLMHPSDAMAIRRMRRSAEEMVQLPFLGEAGEVLPDQADRKSA